MDSKDNGPKLELLKREHEYLSQELRDWRKSLANNVYFTLVAQSVLAPVAYSTFSSGNFGILTIISMAGILILFTIVSWTNHAITARLSAKGRLEDIERQFNRQVPCSFDQHETTIQNRSYDVPAPLKRLRVWFNENTPGNSYQYGLLWFYLFPNLLLWVIVFITSLILNI